MQYDIPAPPQNFFSRLMWRLTLAASLAWAFFFGVVMWFLFRNIEATVYMVLAVLATKALLGYLQIRNQSRRPGYAMGGNMAEACKLTLSDAGVLVESATVTRCYPWAALAGVNFFGGMLSLNRARRGTVCAICVQSLPAETVKGMREFMEACLAKQEEDGAEEEDIYNLSVEELRARAEKRSRQPDPAKQTPVPAKPAPPAEPPVPAPFAEGVETFSFSSTPEQVEEFSLYATRRMGRLQRNLVWLAAFMALVSGVEVNLSMVIAEPLVACFFILFVWWMLRCTNFAKRVAAMLQGSTRSQWMEDGLIVQDAQGAWTRLRIIGEEYEVVRLPHTLCVYGRKANTCLLRVDADTQLPAGLPAAGETVVPKKPKRAIVLVAFLLGIALAEVWHVEVAGHYGMFRDAVAHETPDTSRCTPETLILADSYVPGEERVEDPWLTAKLFPRTGYYELTYYYGSYSSKEYLSTTLYILPSGHVFYSSSERLPLPEGKGDDAKE